MNLFLFKLTGTSIGFTVMDLVTVTKELILTVKLWTVQTDYRKFKTKPTNLY